MPPTHTQPVLIASTFRGATVLLTGATGFVGSLVLEALLRTTDVQRVYVLLRPKGGDSPRARLEKLLQARVFHKVRDNPALLSKVHPLQGDITSRALGLSDSDSQALAEVAVILHAAADIRLEADIHTALTANCLGTQAVLALARGCRQLRALVHTSSCFVNMHLPASSVVEERIYPLSWGGRRVEPEALIQDLMCLPPAAADDRACALGRRWGFPNNYTLSKHLAEQLVAQAAEEHHLPVCIVRPSLVTAVLYEPIPGHIDGWAGPIGASAAIALGLYHSLPCVSSQPLHVWDVMPADLVVNAILASAAATAAGGAAGSLAASSSSSSTSAAPPLLIVHSSSSSTYPFTLMEGWNAALEFLAAHPPKMRLCRGLPARMTPAFQPDPAVVRRHRRWTAFKVRAACWLLRLFGLRRAAARLQSGFEALCVYGTSKTDRDLTFSAAALEALERRLPPAESAAHPLVMRPGMRLPRVLASSAGGGGSSSSSSGAPLVAATPSSSSSSGSSPAAEQGVLTWRRCFHTQLAAVYSALYQVKVPRAAAGCVEHDFVFIR